MKTFKATITITEDDLERLNDLLGDLDQRAAEYEDDFPERAAEYGAQYGALNHLVASIYDAER